MTGPAGWRLEAGWRAAPGPLPRCRLPGCRCATLLLLPQPAAWATPPTCSACCTSRRTHARRRFPLLNSRLDPSLSEVLQLPQHNIGVAMATPTGLVVPNIKDVASLSLLEIAGELERLRQAAAAGKLGAEDLSGGTITVSNIGGWPRSWGRGA
jgi:hypothetical protein